jgi:RNA polymerase sigma factor (sigma-70 family)
MDAAKLFSEHYPALYRYLVRLTGDGDAADDAAQEAFVTLMERPPREGATRAWLFTVATNAARGAARTGSRRRAILERVPDRAPMADPPLDPARELERSRTRERVQRALGMLAERDRTILLMREEGFTHQEIADAVGTTVKSVGTMIARALDRLALQLPLDEEGAR